MSRFKPGDKVRIKNGLTPKFTVQLENGVDAKPIRFTVGEKVIEPNGWVAVVGVEIKITFEREANGKVTTKTQKLLSKKLLDKKPSR